jgi:hypothetical protein
MFKFTKNIIKKTHLTLIHKVSYLLNGQNCTTNDVCVDFASCIQVTGQSYSICTCKAGYYYSVANSSCGKLISTQR